jgi:NAD+ diphosphatase
MDLKEHKYIPGFLKQDACIEKAWVLAFMDKKLLMRKEADGFYIPKHKELADVLTDNSEMEYIGRFEEHDCYCTCLMEMPNIHDSFETVNIREITNLTGNPDLFLLAGNANHILNWRNANRYCGCCGHKTIDKKDERAVLCPGCGHIVYPRISPATITAILHEDKILLAHNRNFKEGLYSLIAGFVEPGETLEHCVAREILEEVGVKVKNIQYFSSQPWPFPDSLMIAFTAEYDGCEILVDQSEITDASWFTADTLPDIPSNDSVAGKIIRWYRDRQ